MPDTFEVLARQEAKRGITTQLLMLDPLDQEFRVSVFDEEGNRFVYRLSGDALVREEEA